jgi:hypothetical protein
VQRFVIQDAMQRFVIFVSLPAMVQGKQSK